MRTLQRLITTCLLLTAGIVILAPQALYSDTKPTILVVRQQQQLFEDFYKILEVELGSYQLHDFILKPKPDYDRFKAEINQRKPQLLILLDNTSIDFAQRYNRKAANPIFAVATMGLNLKHVLQASNFISGVAFEVPIYTSIVALRSISKKPIRRVLTVYRKDEFAAFIADARHQLKREQIILSGFAVDQYMGNSESLNRALKKTLRTRHGKKQFDAIWVMSDNRLMNRNNFRDLWLPKAQELDIPFVCGLKYLAKPDLDFCTFAATPDLKDLGAQIADQVLLILDEGHHPKELGVEYLLSPQFTINKRKAQAIDFEFSVEQEGSIEVVE
ncbi:hypothetical protein [Pseudobacteriovorax antillogorgiicola]|uniref:ABC transporter substrate binding protein n=1 Tax=Pseudobacteriovorax antillogorgiicola TaxID=1513793 RepID=A0A1Y6B9C4_9BACT|nr:hypothetical protein [Pseudobacteriovorax antillogorgiicola]TCS57576.1 ABC transporter substrate binding protein [Pseudobacteriovorax antillogorgiicola]SME99646.1 ABC transporter substrate binding protein [Pseudobacteriovorax antillogorgiicola]